MRSKPGQLWHNIRALLRPREAAPGSWNVLGGGAEMEGGGRARPGLSSTLEHSGQGTAGSFRLRWNLIITSQGYDYMSSARELRA